MFFFCFYFFKISHHGWRSKQELIESVHQQLMWKYRERVIRPPTPILIGKEVVRIHVKKWQQLCNIEIALKEIERPHIPEKDDYAPGLGIRFSLMSYLCFFLFVFNLFLVSRGGGITQYYK